MNDHPAFNRVMHIAHHEWHGIRHATAYCPGRKLLIPADQGLGPSDHEEIVRMIEVEGIDRVVFQGYSETADQLALHLRGKFCDSLKVFVVTHVTTSQFDNFFEMTMQARLFMRLRYGTIDGIGSVKPRFHEYFPDYFKGTIVNFAPNVSDIAAMSEPEEGCIFIPLDVSWRKNMYTNIIGALAAPGVREVWTANFPNGLESLIDLRRLRLIGYQRGPKLLSKMAQSWTVLMATLAECQPMTQLEAWAVGTPALTGPLELEEFASDPLIRMSEIDRLDSPYHVAKAVARVVEFRSSDPVGSAEMIRDHLGRRHAVAFERYADFVGL